MLRVFADSPVSGPLPAKASRRWLALGISSLIHAGAAALLLSTRSYFLLQPSPLPDYKVVVIPLKPKERLPKEKLIWSPVPEVTPLERFGPEDTPHGEKDPLKQVLIAQAKNPDSTKQLIHQPEHPLPLPADVPTPNLVALHADNPQPKPAPRVFVPPPPPPSPVKSPEPHPTVLEPLPALPSTMQPPKVQARTGLEQFLAPVAKVKPKPFVPSVALPKTHVAAEIAPMRDVPPVPSSPGSVSNRVLGPESVIVSLNPGLAPPPQGSRSAQFAKAPAAGTPSSGLQAQTGAVTVPGLVAHGLPAAPMKPPPFASPTGSASRAVVKEILVPGVNRTMSAPLRPSSRIIPLSVEQQFTNRNVYALVIPGPEIPGYPGDWVMWFSERQPVDDPRQRITAPVPLRKFATEGNTGNGAPIAATIQFAVLLDKGGRVASLKIIKGRADAAFKLKAMQELEAWDFKPALRNGEAIEVDMVLEIPLQLKVPEEASK